VGGCYQSVVGGDIVVKDKIRVKEIDNPNVKFPGKNGKSQVEYEVGAK